MSGRRRFLKRASSILGLSWMGYEGYDQFIVGNANHAAAFGFHGDAPELLGPCSHDAEYFDRRGDDIVCTLCPHGCILADGDRGFCRTRAVVGGRLRTLAYGNLCALSLDPVEKKPLYHFLPQTPIASVAMGGCNLRCPNCQNWQISQSRPEDVQRYEVTPEALVRIAKQRSSPSIAYTYTEPMVCFEYVRDTAKLAREAGIKNVLVTAGYVNQAPLEELAKYVDAVQLDVKAFDDRSYRRMARGELGPVLGNLRLLREAGVWLEVSFLMVSQLSDEPKDVEGFAKWVVGNLGADVPLHLLRFHPAHRLSHLPPTPVALLQRAYDRAKQAGLHFVYLGNVPGLGGGETRCPNDGELLIERRGYHVIRNRLVHGACPTCGTRIAGIFEG